MAAIATLGQQLSDRISRVEQSSEASRHTAQAITIGSEKAPVVDIPVEQPTSPPVTRAEGLAPTFLSTVFAQGNVQSPVNVPAVSVQGNNQLDLNLLSISSPVVQLHRLLQLNQHRPHG